jgi:signal transduction histidine kinase
MAALSAVLVLGLLAGGLLLEHRRRRAELDARRYLATMAHLDRRAAMGELAASLAHELHQPLGAILRNAEAAMMLLASGSPAPVQELQEIVEDIRKDDKRAGDLIRRMRTLLRRRELETQLVELNAVARDTIELVAPEAASKGVRVDVEESIDSSMVVGDRVYLQQVLLNLVLNSMDAMADMPAHRRRLLVRTARNNGHVDVSVEDTGRGIAAAALPYVFEPFFTTKPEGMGMGLSIARRIVQAHDGRIVAGNNAEGGATVRFSLPGESPEKGTRP